MFKLYSQTVHNFKSNKQFEIKSRENRMIKNIYKKGIFRISWVETNSILLYSESVLDFNRNKHFKNINRNKIG